MNEMAEEQKQGQTTPAAPPRAEGAPSGAPSSGHGGGHSGHAGQGGHSGPPRREGGPGGGPGGPRRGKRQYFRKKKVCKFCVEKMDLIDYKRADILSQFVQERGKILPRRMTGVCARHQRWLGVAIKRARNIALLPFAGSAAGSSAPRQVELAKPQAPTTPPPAAPPATTPRQRRNRRPELLPGCFSCRLFCHSERNRDRVRGRAQRLNRVCGWTEKGTRYANYSAGRCR